jgi:flagellar motor switch/type III secretory pathway protein FliN
MAATAITPPMQITPVQTTSDSASLWIAAQSLPCHLGIELPAIGFTVRDLLQLEPNSLLATSCRQSSNVPLSVNGRLLAWAEFEVFGNKLAVRLTELV